MHQSKMNRGRGTLVLAVQHYGFINAFNPLQALFFAGHVQGRLIAVPVVHEDKPLMSIEITRFIGDVFHHNAPMSIEDKSEKKKQSQTSLNARLEGGVRDAGK